MPNIESKPELNPKGVFAHIPVEALFESQTNPREHYDKQKQAELTESARQHGIIEPLIVRRVGKRFEIIAGSRRYRAAKAARLDTVPCSIRELDDEKALEFQLIENLNRDDLHPLEEGKGFNRILELPGYTVDTLALKTGHEPQFIFRRRQLTKLIPSFAKLFLDDKINIGHAQAIARLSEGSQKMVESARVLFGDGGQVRVGNQWLRAEKEPISVKQLEAWIAATILLDLSASPWKKDDASLVAAAGACTACPKRSSANQMLFDDMPKGERCLDRACYETKLEAFIARAETEAKAAGAPLVRIASTWMDPRIKKQTRALDQNDYTVVTKTKTCASVERAIVVYGAADLGQQRDICRNRKCKIHNEFGLGAHDRPPVNSFDDLWRRRKQQLPAKIDEATRCAVFDEVRGEKLDKAIKPFADNGAVIPDQCLRLLFDYMARKFNGIEVPTLMGIAIDSKTKAGETYDGKLLRAYALKLEGAGLARFIVGLALVEAAKEYCYKDGADYKRLQAAAESLGVNWSKIHSAKAKELQADFDKRFEKAKERRAKAAPKKKGKKPSPAKVPK